jgi:quinone-modifying oxidoreductase subunit QmoB
MDGVGSVEDGAGAALKAIQCVEMLSRGEAALPRAGDISHPEFSLQRCTQCKRCTEECPFGALNEDEKGTPEPNPTRCRRCGICLGACPERIVNFKNYSVDMVASMIKAVEVPDEFEEKPRVLVLACENDAIPAFDTIGLERMAYSPFVRIIPVRCLGSINVVWITDAIAKGFDGVMMLGCKYGDDYQCHFIKGSELMDTRGENVREKLEQMALENERVQLHQIQISDYDKIPALIEEFMEVIEQVGPNPFKDM